MLLAQWLLCGTEAQDFSTRLGSEIPVRSLRMQSLGGWRHAQLAAMCSTRGGESSFKVAQSIAPESLH
jgi:hypothetical protein